MNIIPVIFFNFIKKIPRIPKPTSATNIKTVDSIKDHKTISARANIIYSDKIDFFCLGKFKPLEGAPLSEEAPLGKFIYISIIARRTDSKTINYRKIVVFFLCY